MQPAELFDRLHHAGVVLSVDGDGLVVGRADRLTDELRTNIRQHKQALIERLLSVQAANDCTPAPEPEPEPTSWRVLASAYHAHHFKCPVCIAAGRGSRYGQPCGVGAALHVAYDEAARASPMPWDKPKKGQRHD